MLSVVLGKTTSVYGPGELLTGDVVINIPTQCKILDLTVNYCGVSTVGFIVSEGEGKTHVCEKVEETAVHLDVLHPLIKSYRGVVITPGVHTYPFSLQLPQLLPSAFRSPYGQISYYVQVHLQTSTGTFDVRKPYIVLAPVNISLFHASQNRQRAEVLKEYGLIRRKTLWLRASLPKGCFVPGDVIPVFVEVRNETSRPVRYLFCTLKQVTDVIIQLQEKTVSRETKRCLVTLAHEVRKGEGKGSVSWRCQLPTPSQATPTIAASTIVFVTYCVQVSIKMKHVPIPPEVQIPIVLGVRAPLAAVTETSHRQRHVSCQMLQPECSGVDSQPSATNPRRRVTVCTQPPPISVATPTRKVSSNLQSITENLKKRFSRHTEPLSRLSI